MKQYSESHMESITYVPDWAKKAVIYHIYPLGSFGAPTHAHDECGVVPRLANIRNYYHHFKELGVTVVQFGPLFKSFSHGYDTIDYRSIDSRLGSNTLFKEIVDELHSMGIRVIIDGVFNHVSRLFFSFQDIISRAQNSSFTDWHFIDFSKNNSAFNDGFDYRTWEGYYDLVKLNLSNSDVRSYLFDTVRYWMEEIGIDGWRLDVAYSIDTDFWRSFKTVCKSCREDSFLVGEMIHGPYSRLTGPDLLHAVTGYSIYKSIWSSLNDNNMYEIKNVLENHFHPSYGIEKGTVLINFLGNHDTTRIRSILKDQRNVITAFLMLFTFNGIPKIYYGDEFGVTGVKETDSDIDIRRPMLKPGEDVNSSGFDQLEIIRKLIAIRKRNHALIYGDIIPVFADNVHCNILSYLRRSSEQTILVIVNGSDTTIDKTIPLWNQNLNGTRFIDILNEDDMIFTVYNDQVHIKAVHHFWGRILAAI